MAFSKNRTLLNRMRKAAYELYKTHWMERVSTESQLDVTRNYIEEALLEFPDDKDYQSLADFIDEVGYDSGSLYVCFNEFLTAEYTDEEFMRELFGNDDIFNAYKTLDPKFGDN